LKALAAYRASLVSKVTKIEHIFLIGFVFLIVFIYLKSVVFLPFIHKIHITCSVIADSSLSNWTIERHLRCFFLALNISALVMLVVLYPGPD
jgi:ABC-type iron transport system FetAB permease component